MKGEISPGAGAVEEEFDHGVSCVFGASLDSGIALLAPRNGAPFRQLPGLVAEHVLSRFVVQRLLLEFADRQPRLHLRSEEHTSELQSPCNLVCRLLLEKKKKIINISCNGSRYETTTDR